MLEKILITVIEDYITLCDLMLTEGKINETQYEELTKQRKEFLNHIA
ncbi:hypothetical protein HNQ80_003787 [Anaerosolibacter carboniphilus]|uniref:Uncharacterized protein n=1 Tax=Anaerosolibacter carboniphilus TaxID=1417629 RepID=A0A841KVI6_9FIRM|nr:hypothetical protein [Anaerosolibacter carboniphilus]MBB6217664.1 hypothetical protein [Anaerosolibacter carboniphilus]